jgi:hypothetical protein
MGGGLGGDMGGGLGGGTGGAAGAAQQVTVLMDRSWENNVEKYFKSKNKNS